MATKGKSPASPAKTKKQTGRSRVSVRTYQNSLKEAADMFGASSFPAVGLVVTPLPKAAKRIRLYVGI